ncbi:P-loop containing nucleoside triphosphate hydrolase protein [Jimgerdemannia flammicorona]|uniref:P-loop containing nucleoside triphosphate hydrolase protein n=1 Tax=Jimgerdemannia flammicorona TaxID=994334 RepID=A0A433QL78_9FUNG|nr:P-loop containing nucleoside triphosphate hydrolase protein [Jimgerdemannia flammicorona]
MSSGGKVMAVAASVSAVKPPTARHDPMMEGSLVMLRPSKTHQAKWNTGKRPLVDVVVDPLLCAHLREHQRQGVKYLYECVMGMKDYNGQGAILADEMGLGKTLQSIALLWTLLKQNPYHGNQPVVKRALIVCPTTLINNWRHEFKKWLGDERIRVFVVDSKANLSNFLHGRIYSVMIIGYEKLRNVQESLKDAQFDIVIWLGFNFILFTSVLNVKMPLFTDLHTFGQNIKTAQAIRALPTKRRIILSGTPIQNDLGEFFAMVNFINPALFETYAAFKKVCLNPENLDIKILYRNRYFGYPDANLKEPGLSSLYVDSRCLDAYPPGFNSKTYDPVISGKRHSPPLWLIFLLLNPYSCRPCSSPAGKLMILDRILAELRSSTKEKVVLVSNYTQTLDVLERMCKQYSYGFFRLDGSTPTAKRQDYVDKFNSPTCDKFVFLLSSKSGGVGLNLIGASRLVLFDVDW